MDDDYFHVGNGVACHFYNHENCSKGVQCEFCHAPDIRSVRDSRGINVCLHYLQGYCQFGAHVCHYSHDRSYLPTNMAFPTAAAPSKVVEKRKRYSSGKRQTKVASVASAAKAASKATVPASTTDSRADSVDLFDEFDVHVKKEVILRVKEEHRVIDLDGDASKTCSERKEYWDEDEFDRQRGRLDIKNEEVDFWAQGAKPWDGDVGPSLSF